MKHSRLKGYKIIFYIAFIFAIILLGVWRFGLQRINIITNPLTKETSGYLLEMLGLSFILFSVCMKFLIKKDNGLFYLGILASLLGCWIYLRAGTVHVEDNKIILIELLKATLLALAPYSVALYFNEFQNQRYSKMYQPIMIVSAVDWIGCMIALNVSMKTRSTIYMSIQMVIILTLSVCIYTLLIDTIKGKNRYSLYIALGLIGCTIASLIEIAFVYNSRINWIDELYGFGMLFGIVPVGLLTIYKQIQEQKQYEKMLIEEERNFLVKKLNKEIQKPIQKIIHFSEMMMQGCQDQETYQYAGEIQYESENIDKLVENVMSCVRVENGSVNVKKQNIDSVSGMNEIINKCFKQVERKGLELIINIAEDFPRTVYGEYGCILKICNILLDNAIRYTEKGKITLSIGWLPVEKKEIKVFITVEDTGKGFEEEHLQRIKAVFQNPDLSQNHLYMEGVGYGLIAAMGLAKEIDAVLRVESEQNKGTSMSLTFSQDMVDSTPIGEFQNWYDLKKKMPRKFKRKEDIRNEIKEEVRKELEKEKKDARLTGRKAVMEREESADNESKSQFQDAVLQLEKESIHIRNAMKYVANDFEQYLCLMKMFVQTAEEKQNAIRQMLQDSNMKDYTVKTHALKNNARTLGADDLADMAFAQEKASDKADLTYVTEHFELMMQEWNRVKKVFEDYLKIQKEKIPDNEMEKKMITGKSELADELVSEKLKQIISYLDTFKKKEALETVKELLTHELRETIRQGLLDAQDTIQKYDYAKALAIIEKLVG